jgi:flagellar hook protein FlgE
MAVFNIAASAVQAGFRRQSVTANNLANVDTTGFKSARADLENAAGGGVAVGGITTFLDQGPIEPTGRETDLAIQGVGYFRLADGSGATLYTRDGSFGFDAEGRLVDSATGRRVEGDFASPVTPDQPRLARFVNPGGLTALGENALAEGANSGPPVSGASGEPGFGQVRVGALEGSNVDLARELVGQAVNKVYVRANLKSLKAQDEMLGALLDIRR